MTGLYERKQHVCLNFEVDVLLFSYGKPREYRLPQTSASCRRAFRIQER